MNIGTTVKQIYLILRYSDVKRVLSSTGIKESSQITRQLKTFALAATTDLKVIEFILKIKILWLSVQRNSLYIHTQMLKKKKTYLIIRNKSELTLLILMNYINQTSGI